jgi:ParB-like chromosome segregation protein Spo0J
MDAIPATPVMLDVHEIRLEPSLWPRRELDGARVEEFVALFREAGPTALPPLVVAQQNGRGGILTDGWHRYRAALQAGLPEVPVAFLPDASPAAVFAAACDASGVAPKPLSLPEKRDAAKRWFALDPQVTDMRIAASLGLSRNTVASYRARPELGAGDGSGSTQLPDSAAERLRAARKLLRAVVELWEARGFRAHLGDRQRGLCECGTALEEADEDGKARHLLEEMLAVDISRP